MQIVMKDRDLKDYRGEIEARIMALRKQTDATKEARATVELDQQSVGRLSRMDAIERKAMADATQRMRHLETKQLEAALARLEEGSFGYCVECGEEIEAKRLDLSPAVLSCLDCARG